MKTGLENCKKLYRNREIALWDTAGIEKFRANINITKQIRLADVIFLCFDVKTVSSFENLKEYYHKEVTDNIPNYKAIILLGMKSDQSEIAFYEEIRNFILKENLFYAETSIYFDDNFVYNWFSLDVEDGKVHVNSDYKSSNNNPNLFVRAGVNAIIDAALKLVVNYESKITGSDFNKTFSILKTVTLQESESKYPNCKCFG